MNSGRPVDERGSFGGTRRMFREALARPRREGIELSHALPQGRAGQLGDEGPHGTTASLLEIEPRRLGDEAAGTSRRRAADRERHQYRSTEGPLELILSRALHLFRPRSPSVPSPFFWLSCCIRGWIGVLPAAQLFVFRSRRQGFPPAASPPLTPRPPDDFGAYRGTPSLWSPAAGCPRGRGRGGTCRLVRNRMLGAVPPAVCDHSTTLFCAAARRRGLTSAACRPRPRPPVAGAPTARAHRPVARPAARAAAARVAPAPARPAPTPRSRPDTPGPGTCPGRPPPLAPAR
jgi:hypothetical protein